MFGIASARAFFQDDLNRRLLLIVEQRIHRARGGRPEGHAAAPQSPGTHDQPRDEETNDPDDAGPQNGASSVPGDGLVEKQIDGSDQVMYLHPEIVVTNGDIAQSSVAPGNGPAEFWISVEFTPAGTQKMRQATAEHVGRPVAILIDGEVVAAPRLRSPISTSAVISGDFGRAEAETIVDGIRVQ